MIPNPTPNQAGKLLDTLVVGLSQEFQQEDLESLRKANYSSLLRCSDVNPNQLPNSGLGQSRGFGVAVLRQVEQGVLKCTVIATVTFSRALQKSEQYIPERISKPDWVYV